MSTSTIPRPQSVQGQANTTVHSQDEQHAYLGPSGPAERITLPPQPGMGEEVIKVDSVAPSATSQTLRRGPWSPQEDRRLMESINLFGPTNWVRISQSLVSRTPKQCRERYHQNLKPSLNRNPISPEEGQLIEELVAKHGKRWAEIARHLNGRSDNAIKNWWNGGTNRRRRASSQAILQEPHPDQQNVQPLEYQQAAIIGYPQYYPGPPQSAPQPAFNTAIFQSEQPLQPPLQAIQQQRLQPGPAPGVVPPHIMHPQHQSLPPHQQLPPNYLMQPQQLAAPHLQQPQQQLPSQQQQMLPPLNPSRSSSVNQDIFTQQAGVKRFLEEQHLPARRHSAQTILTSTGGSSSPFSHSSRNSSISFDWSNNTTVNSQSNSRRSSLAHELFPNPLAHQSKRQNSHSSSYLSPNIQSQRGSTAGIVPLHMTMTQPPHTSQSQSSEPPVFKSEFSFNKEGVKLPPPSSIPTNPAFTPSAMLNREKKESPKSEEEKGVMNISNLLE